MHVEASKNKNKKHCIEIRKTTNTCEMQEQVHCQVHVRGNNTAQYKSRSTHMIVGLAYEENRNKNKTTRQILFRR